MRLHLKYLFLPLYAGEEKCMQLLFSGQGALDLQIWICVTWTLFSSISFMVPLTLDFFQSMDRDVYLLRLTPLPIQVSPGNEVLSSYTAVMRQREGGMNPGPETSSDHHCLIGEPRLHLFSLVLGEKDSTALLWDTPTATRTRAGSPN